MDHHGIDAFHRVGAVPAEGDFLRAEHEGTPTIIDLHVVAFDFVGIAEDREEDGVQQNKSSIVTTFWNLPE